MSIIYSKLSFDRFCDDFCELILSYLSFEEKFRYECVSKQFKRCIYQKQNHLEFTNQLYNKLKRTDLLSNKYIDLDLTESMLKKLPNVNNIFIKTFENQLNTNFVQMIELIINNYNYLYSIDIYITEQNEELFNKFFKKFGPKLRKIGFNNNSDIIESHLILTQNLYEINLKRLNDNYLTKIFFDSNQVFV